jgi:hypothetical protein
VATQFGPKEVHVETSDPTAPIVITVSEYHGKTRLDIRHYWTPEGEDHPVPTKKGVNIPIEGVADFMNALNSLFVE